MPDTSSEVVPEILNALGEPTLQSVGLGGWTPPGLVQQALDVLHVSLGLPWWGAIITGQTFILKQIMFSYYKIHLEYHYMYIIFTRYLGVLSGNSGNTSNRDFITCFQ